MTLEIMLSGWAEGVGDKGGEKKSRLVLCLPLGANMWERGKIRLHISRFHLESLSCLVYETVRVEEIYSTIRLKCKLLHTGLRRMGEGESAPLTQICYVQQ